MSAIQTANAISQSDCKIEISANGTAWTDISGETASVDPGEQTRQSGVIFTHAGDTAIVTGGKREPIDITIKFVYTEQNTEAAEVLRAIHEAVGGAIYVRYSPKNGATGAAQFTSDKGVLTSYTYPATDAGEGKAVMGGIKVKTPKLTRSLIAA